MLAVADILLMARVTVVERIEGGDASGEIGGSPPVKQRVSHSAQVVPISKMLEQSAGPGFPLAMQLREAARSCRVSCFC
jgi:hypothetical protein